MVERCSHSGGFRGLMVVPDTPKQVKPCIFECGLVDRLRFPNPAKMLGSSGEIKYRIGMANADQMDRLKDVESWNRWRRESPEVAIDLAKADLSELNLRGINLRDANLESAVLTRTDLCDADLRGSLLEEVTARYVRIERANLKRAKLRLAILEQAWMEDANLRFADLQYADLSMARLENADLAGASLFGANCNGTFFDGANLRDTRLTHATLINASLDGTSLADASVGFTTFVDVDLSKIGGLASVRHEGPSTIGVDTIYKSGGKIPESFLRGCGVPESFITQIDALVGAEAGIQFYSCFISYSGVDEEFAKRLHGKMRDAHLRVWFAPEDMKGGEWLHEQIETAIRMYDKLLIVLSEASLKSDWVTTELRRAVKAARESGKRKLFPVRLVDNDTLRNWRCDDSSGIDLAEEIRQYFIPDFSHWKDHDSFESSFARLLKDLKAESPAAR